MKSARGFLAVAAISVAGFLATAPGSSAAASGPIIETAKTQVDARLQTLTLTTPALPAPTNVNVLLPDGYDSSGQTRYPVLYLLHGGASSYRDWVRNGGAEAATAGLNLIVVMPDCGLAGWYTDWFAPGTNGQQPKWETFHIEQLIPWIDSQYRTVADRSGRAIGGLSMGGFGAFSYAARHPDLFVAASSWSGALNTNDPPQLAAETIDAIGALAGAAPGSLFGPRATEEIRWRGHNPWDLAANLRGMLLQMRSGNGQPGGPLGGTRVDGLESEVHPMNVDMDARLTSLGIEHTFDDYGPGAHSWPYWSRDLQQDLPSIMATFEKQAPPPSRITYKSIEPVYSVFGWKVSVKRKVVEFSTLTKAGRKGFSLSGSGSATVTTPPLYRKRQTFLVKVAGSKFRRKAGPGGRLKIRVDLGPSNTVQANSVPEINDPQPSVTRKVSIIRVQKHG